MRTKEDMKVIVENFQKKFEDVFKHEAGLKNTANYVTRAKEIFISTWTDEDIKSHSLTWDELELMADVVRDMAVANDLKNAESMIEKFHAEQSKDKKYEMLEVALNLLERNAAKIPAEKRLEIAKKFTERAYLDDEGHLKVMSNKQYKDAQRIVERLEKKNEENQG